MATEQNPNQNVNVPISESALARARERLDPGRSIAMRQPGNGGKGSRREVRKGEWLDDRVINIGGPSSASEDSPPKDREGRATPPASYDPLKVYGITLGKPAVFAGRTLAPGKQYTMVGAACTAVAASVIDAVEIGDVPADPDVAPSAAQSGGKTSSKSSKG